MANAHHGINAVVKGTGLSAHVIRIWEKRYSAVQPERTGTNRRLYSDEDIERLNLLRRLTEGGHSIGQIASLPLERLQELEKLAEGNPQPARPAISNTARYLDQCVEAVHALNPKALHNFLELAALDLGNQGVLLRVIGPLAQRLGDLWRDGTITAAHEHFASAVIRTFLAHRSRPFVFPGEAPELVVATPSGQIHELGALLVAATATNLGWHVTFLGASLPATEIAGAVRQNRARAVALSLVYPEDDPRLENELLRLRELIPADVAILAGGRAMPAYRSAINKIGATQLDDLSALCSALDELRKPQPTA